MIIWSIQTLLQKTQQYFTQKNILSSRLDAELLMAHALGVNRVYLYTHGEQTFTAPELDTFRDLVRRRGLYEPVAYLVGVREFYGRDFIVNPAVLIPRPETEHIVEAALAFVQQQQILAPRILDIGCGSGALAVTLAAQLPEAYVVACDISAAAIACAHENAKRQQVENRVTFLCGDVWEPLLPEHLGSFDVVVSNPPYIDLACQERLAPDVKNYEPAIALFAEDAGFAVIEKLCQQAHTYMTPNSVLLCEIGDANQANRMTACLQANHAWHSVETLLDLQQLPRVVKAVSRAI